MIFTIMIIGILFVIVVMNAFFTVFPIPLYAKILMIIGLSFFMCVKYAGMLKKMWDYIDESGIEIEKENKDVKKKKGKKKNK